MSLAIVLSRIVSVFVVWYAGYEIAGLDIVSGAPYGVAVGVFQCVFPVPLVAALLGMDHIHFAWYGGQWEFGKRFRTVPTRPPPPHTAGRMLSVLLRNQACSAVAVGVFFASASASAWYPFPHIEPKSMLESAAMTVVYALSFEVLFYAGHRAMHLWGPLRPLHHLHHQTHTNSALSYGYMSLADYTLEFTIPAIGPLWVWGLDVPGHLGFVALGLLNTVLVHSGWDLPVLGSPGRHRLHHSAHHANYGNGPLDRLLYTHG